MSQKKIIPFINGENELSSSIVSLADKYSCEGADSLYLYNYTGDEASHEEFLHTLRTIEKDIDIPFIAGVHVNRFEDAKKALYTGHIGDGKIFVYDVEDVVKVRTGESGFDALQDDK